jgi:hypothetical protein
LPLLDWEEAGFEEAGDACCFAATESDFSAFVSLTVLLGFGLS